MDEKVTKPENKKIYNKPEVTSYGDVKELTQAKSSTNLDMLTHANDQT